MELTLSRTAVYAIAADVYSYQLRANNGSDNSDAHYWIRAKVRLEKANPHATATDLARAMRLTIIEGSQQALDALKSDQRLRRPLAMPPAYRSLFTETEWRRLVTGKDVFGTGHL